MIKNKTRGIILVKSSKKSDSIFFKAIGLMFSRKLKDFGLIFVFNKETNISLHMLFVFFTIDVLFLDKNRKVIEVKQKFLPFTFYFPQMKYMYVVELPAGVIRQSKTKVGDYITFS